MSEMLGNRYFIARQYDKAAEQLEEVLKKSSDPVKVKKKLIICYIQTGQIDKALHFFFELVSLDPNLIIDTDPYHEDCPCPELVMAWEKPIEIDNLSLLDHESLGILYLYCDLNKSLYYLRKALPESKNKNILSSIIKKLSSLETV